MKVHMKDSFDFFKKHGKKDKKRKVIKTKRILVYPEGELVHGLVHELVRHFLPTLF